ncbi:ExeA family protein [Planctomycetes bacterium K23_9]|uniref:ORC1/DEAH AAA+ ATPase domain-containing protein n=1 Tax=Stieleria marina TaxID=1930275 RepID=A0A517NW40_9BACT|nr:hypothetical protein K239x_33360 [Planctomycetes bacterium K23_9]
MSTSPSNASIPPFPPFPSAARYVDFGSTKDTVARVSRAINSGESLALVIGPPGVGKSLVCNVLAQQFAEMLDVVMLGEIPITDAASYYRAVLHHLGVDYQSIAEGDLYVSLVDRITVNAADKNGLLIIVDEAQMLSAEVLDAIRTTTNIMKHQQPWVSAVVCGGVKLEDTLASSSMEAFTQRVATRCYLHPMNATETRQYISESIRACGSDPDATMTDEAMGAVHHACNGVPRLINQMMTEAIDCAADAEQTIIDESVVDRAWATLQQLPSPMVEEQKIVSQGAPIEFGSLSELSEMRTISDVSGQSAAVETSSVETDTVETSSVETESLDDAFDDEQDEEVASLGEIGTDEELDVVDTSNESKLAFAAGTLADDLDSEIDAEADEMSPQMRLLSGETQSAGEADGEIDAMMEQAEEAAVEAAVIEETAVEETAVEEAPAIQAEQPTIVSVQMTPATTQLFGEFDAEESLSVAEMVSQKPSLVSQSEVIAPADEIEAELTAEAEEAAAEEQFAEVEAVEIIAEEVAESDDTVSRDVVSFEAEVSEQILSVAALPQDNLQEISAVDASHEPPAEMRHTQSIDFEASLHDEVLLLNEMATQARFGGIDQDNTFANPEQPAMSSHEQPPIWLAEEQVAIDNSEQSIGQPTGQPNASDTRQFDQPERMPEPCVVQELDDMQILNDDSDLLIIEDELDVVPRPHVADVKARDTTIDVDFQAMLSKMRTGT